MALRTSLMVAAAALAAVAGPRLAGAEPDPSVILDGEWVLLTGPVAPASDGRIGLAYSGGRVVLAMDEEARRVAGRLEQGGWVAAAGRMDEDFAARGVLETDTLYVHDPGLLLSTRDAGHVSDLDRALASYGHALAGAGGAKISVAGVIEAIERDSITLRTPAMVLRVDTEELGYSPYRRNPYGGRRSVLRTPRRTALEVGDHIRVTGELDAAVLDRRELRASVIVLLPT